MMNDCTDKDRINWMERNYGNILCDGNGFWIVEFHDNDMKNSIWERSIREAIDDAIESNPGAR